ncbi:MAG: NAD-dependent epimerase/dehydratase family protein [Tepidisphaeraceae bacterium]
MRLSQTESIGVTPRPTDVDALEDLLSEPPDYLVKGLAQIPGDILVLGVGGKMGPTLARMAKRSALAAGDQRRVIGVSRFGQADERERLERAGVETIRCDLLNDRDLAALPDAKNIIYMAGMKFGTTGNEGLTWAMNAYLPGRVCQRFPNSRFAAFSTGNLYGLTPIATGGSVETDTLQPAGDYAMSCVGRERMFQHFSHSHGLAAVIIRLNYACELRYGVLVDLAQKVWAGQPIDLAMGHINAIWQGDANAMALAALALADSPASVLNIAGPELLSVRRVAEQMAERMGRSVEFVGTERPDALLNNAQKSHALFGYPQFSVSRLIDWTADWIKDGGATLNKPTHFEARDGKF